MKFGNEDTSTLTRRMNLAAVFISQKLFDPAQKEFQIVYDLRKKKLSEDHIDTIQAESWVGACLGGQKRFTEALPIEGDVWARKKRLLGEVHRHTLTAGFNLAVTEVDGGNREESKRL